MKFIKALKVHHFVAGVLLMGGLYACDASERREKTIDGPPTESFSTTESDTVTAEGDSYTDRTDHTLDGSLPEHPTPREVPKKGSGVQNEPSAHSDN